MLKQANFKKLREPQVKRFGSGKPVLAVVAGMHGDEKIPVRVLKEITRFKFTKGTVLTIIANPEALTINKRFIDFDLNRSFPGDKNGSGEKLLAYQLLELISKADYVLDLHTTSAKTPPFVIVGSYEKGRMKLAEMTGIERIVLFESSKKHAMVDYARCGIGLELGIHDSWEAFETGLRVVRLCFGSLTMIEFKNRKKIKHKFYKVIGKVKKLPDFTPNQDLTNFRLVKRGEVVASQRGRKLVANENFYPVFFGEKAYVGTLCLKAIKLEEKEI